MKLRKTSPCQLKSWDWTLSCGVCTVPRRGSKEKVCARDLPPAGLSFHTVTRRCRVRYQDLGFTWKTNPWRTFVWRMPFRELKTEKEDLRDDSPFNRPLWKGFVSPTLCAQIKEKESTFHLSGLWRKLMQKLRSVCAHASGYVYLFLYVLQSVCSLFFLCLWVNVCIRKQDNKGCKYW